MDFRIRNAACAAGALSLAACLPSHALAQPIPGFYLTGHAPATESSLGAGISADGSVVAGWSGTGVRAPGFTWTAQNGRRDVDFNTGTQPQSVVHGLSGDGRTLVGEFGADFTRPLVACRYSGPGTFQSLGLLPGIANSRANAASNDGNVIAGNAYEFGGVSRAFRWTPATGIQALPFARPGDFTSEANAVSRDGRVIVGSSFGAGIGDNIAFAWTESGGMRALAWSGRGGIDTADATNFDGSIIVGESNPLGVATIWSGGLRTELPLPSGYFRSVALGTSDDGRVIVGGMTNGRDGSGVVWTPDHGAELLTDYLARNGIQVPAGYTLGPQGVSADGRTIYGSAYSAGAGQDVFVVTIPTSSTLAVLIAFGLSASASRRRPAPLRQNESPLTHLD